MAKEKDHFLKLPMLYREMSMSARKVKKEDEEDEDENGLYEVAISSETPIRRFFGVEILGHDDAEVDMTRLERGAAVLINHNGGDHVGVVREARIDKDKVLRGKIQFSRSTRGKEIEQDVLDGIRQNISVGYFPLKVKLIETKKVDGAEVDVYRVTLWQPAEVSIVGVPADTTVGVGRDAEAGRLYPVEIEDGGAVRRDQEMTPEEKAAQEAAAKAAREKAEADAKRAGAETLENRNEAIGEILDVCEANGIEQKQAREWIKEGLTVEQVGLRIVRERKTKGNPQPPAESFPLKDRKRYSYARAILLGATIREGGRPSGVEWEMHQEIEKKMAGAGYVGRGGVLVPCDLRTEEERWAEYEVAQMKKRTLDSITSSKGPEAVFEVMGEFIELLRNKSVVIRKGARVLTGLSGPVAFTKQTGAMSVSWVGENPASDVTETDVALGLVHLAPKTLQASTSYSRQLLALASIDVEAMVRDEISTVHALAVDKAVFHGKGAAGEPEGIYFVPDVNANPVGGVPDYADVLLSVEQVADDNALMGALGWCTTNKTASRLKQVPEIASVGPPIWTGSFLEGVLAGFGASATNQLSRTMTGSTETGGAEHGTIFGNWADVIIGMFNALELIADPFAKKKRGLIEVTSFEMVDHILRHGESFSKWTGNTP